MQNQPTLNTDTPNAQSLISRLLHYAQTTPEHDAVVTPTFTLTYRQLTACVLSQVMALKDIGISQATTVGIHCVNDAQHLVLTLAASYLGATSCTIPSYENIEAQQAIKDHCDVTQVLDESVAIDLQKSVEVSEFKNNEEQAPKSCLLFSTSGSTGTPKLVMHLDCDLVAQAHRHVGSAKERFTCRASMEHNFAKRHRLYCVAVGASNVFLNEELDSVVKDCLKLKVNVMHVSAFQAQELLSLSNINQLAHIKLKLGGSHVPEALRNALRTNITSTLQAGYGTTETGAIAFTDPNDLDASESVGQALPGIEIRCVDGKHNSVKQGVRGEVAIRCKGMFRGYYKQPNITAQRLDHDWFYTGDIAYLDMQHRIHLCGRSDDMFTFNSMNIYPQEIESVIRQFPNVINAVVLPKPSSSHGNIPIALVAFNPTMKPRVSALKKFVEKQVGTRSPRQYIFVDEIPTNTAGKISRVAASTLTEKSDEIRKTLIDLLEEGWINNVKPSQINDFIDGKRDLSFRRLGMDSLARMNLLVSLEVNYDIVISPQELTRLRTLGKLASRIITHTEVSSATQQEATFDNIIASQASPPFIVRFFQRLSRYCKTVAELNQSIAKLEHRLTPLDIAYLDLAHANNEIVELQTSDKFRAALSAWLSDTKQLMVNSGNSTPQTFTMKRITPNINLFSNGNHSGKTLLISFPPRGVRHLMIPTPVLLQHIDASQYDLLMITPEPDGGYQFGTLPFGRKLKQQAQWLRQQPWFNTYQNIRTFGFSAGGFPAIALGYLLNAEVALSIAGRFHKKKRFLINLDKIMTMRQVLKLGHCGNVLLSYSQYNKRDQKFAAYFAKVSEGKEVAIEIKTERLPHLLLRRLAERGELFDYFARTLFSELPVSNKRGAKETIQFPLPIKP